MKIAPRDIKSFIEKPSEQARVVLVYGPENGLIKERIKKISGHYVADFNDPFNSSVLLAEEIINDPARLDDEVNAISMMGGIKVVRIEEATDKITKFIKDYLDSPNMENIVLIEAGALGPSSSLRKLCESDKNSAAIPCYVEEERDLIPLIREMLRESEHQIDNDALTWLASNLAGNRQRVIKEIEKLIIYKGAEKTSISINEAMECCGDSSVRSLDNLIYAAFSGKKAETLKTYNILLNEGAPIIMVVRALQNHIRKILLKRG
jgi:DNA polymerase-3 subunit delta